MLDMANSLRHDPEKPVFHVMPRHGWVMLFLCLCTHAACQYPNSYSELRFSCSIEFFTAAD